MIDRAFHVAEAGTVAALLGGGAVYNLVCALMRPDALVINNWTWFAIFTIAFVISLVYIVVNTARSIRINRAREEVQRRAAS